MIVVQTVETPDVTCSCYGCSIRRQRAGIRLVDRSTDSCDPADACATHGRCWTHSEWLDESACDPPGACRGQIAFGTHRAAAARR